MGDIRDELRERLRVIEVRLDEENERYNAERRRIEAEHAHKIEALHERRKALITIIDAENEESGAPMMLPRTPMRIPLKEYFLTALVTRGPQSKDDLKEAAILAGFFSDASSAGRVTHATVMNMTSSGQLIKLPDGRYAKADRTSGPLFGPTMSSSLDELDERFEAPASELEEASQG